MAVGSFVSEPRIRGGRGLSQPEGIWVPKFSYGARGNSVCCLGRLQIPLVLARHKEKCYKRHSVYHGAETLNDSAQPGAFHANDGHPRDPAPHP